MKANDAQHETEPKRNELLVAKIDKETEPRKKAKDEMCGMV